MWDTGKKRPSTVYETLEAHEGHQLVVRSLEGKMEAYCTGCGSVVFSAAKSCVGGLRTHTPESTPEPAKAKVLGSKTAPLSSFSEWKQRYMTLKYLRDDAHTEEEWADMYKRYVRESVKNRKSKAPKKSRVEKAWDASI